MLGSVIDDGDINLTRDLIEEYCRKHETDLRIIFDYFYSDVKTVALNRNWLSGRQKYLFNKVPITSIRFFFVKYCQRRVAQIVTSQLYCKSLHTQSSPLSSSLSSTSNQIITLFWKYLPLSLILFMMNWIQTQFFATSPLLFTVLTMTVIIWTNII